MIGIDLLLDLQFWAKVHFDTVDPTKVYKHTNIAYFLKIKTIIHFRKIFLSLYLNFIASVCASRKLK